MTSFLSRNENGVDRAIRVLIGIVALALVFIGPKTEWGWLGALPLITGLVGRCPMYSLLGISTHKA